ncbi:hypothetical protein N7451_012349 [Penicillium sp. IBT 35674x]|nr:hypothetical protein N7451_012349 [Penicillium sp. IBT 35674x]
MATFIVKQIMGTSFQVTKRYSGLQLQSLGTFGVVCSANDSFTNQKVAIKKIGGPVSSMDLAKRMYREVRLLGKLRHGNLINMRDVFTSPSEDLYIVTECFMTDLRQLMQSISKPLEVEFAQFFTYQILPSNILINDNCDLKICDFGLARKQNNQMTGYVTTRYYRALEVMLIWQSYTSAVDLWNVGCMVAEMILGRILYPGQNHIHQFTLISGLLGKPPKEVMKRIYSKSTLEHVESLPEPKTCSFIAFFQNAHPQAVDILGKLLDLDPEKRVKAADALSHPFVSTYHDPEDGPVSEKPVDWSFMSSELSPDLWKTLMWAS